MSSGCFDQLYGTAAPQRIDIESISKADCVLETGVLGNQWDQYTSTKSSLYLIGSNGIAESLSQGQKAGIR